MELTPNIKLKKPAQTDYYNIDDFNANADILDTEIKALKDNSGGVTETRVNELIDNKTVGTFLPLDGSEAMTGYLRLNNNWGWIYADDYVAQLGCRKTNTDEQSDNRQLCMLTPAANPTNPEVYIYDTKDAVSTKYQLYGEHNKSLLSATIKELLQGGEISMVKSVQRGESSSAGDITITEVNMEKAVVISASKGSSGYVAARGNVSLSSTSSGLYAYGSSTGNDRNSSIVVCGLSKNSSVFSMSGASYNYPSRSGALGGGDTDLTVKQFSATLKNSTTLSCDGPVEWQVVEFY